MRIANPTYDVVFKYLMEDSKIAKLILSTIIGEEVLSLSFKPQEGTTFLPRASLTVYRLDFSAKIKTPEGSKVILIEIQKAKFPTDIMRFRKYLGEQYKNEENTKTKIVNKRERKVGIPILSIYFLGHELEYVKVPFLKIERNFIDPGTKKTIQMKEKEDFIESLTHDSFIIQIPHLRKKHQTEMDQLLGIFDQRHIDSDQHILNINEEDYPTKYRPLIRRLQKAVSEPEMRKSMDIEDEVLEELEALERTIAEKDQRLAEQSKNLAEQSKNLAEQSKNLAEKDQSLAEKDQSLAEKDQSLAEKDQSLAEKEKLIEEFRKQIESK